MIASLDSLLAAIESNENIFIINSKEIGTSKSANNNNKTIQFAHTGNGPGSSTPSCSKPVKTRI